MLCQGMAVLDIAGLLLNGRDINALIPRRVPTSPGSADW